MSKLTFSPRQLALFSSVAMLVPLLGALVLYWYLPSSYVAVEGVGGLYAKAAAILLYFSSLVVAPFLIARAVYFLVKMILRGRREGVRPFSPQLLFNPLNLVLFKSLLNERGLVYRQRLLVSLGLFALLLTCMVLVTRALDGSG